MFLLTYNFLLPSLCEQTFCLQGISSLLRPEGQIQLNLLLLGSVKYKHLHDTMNAEVQGAGWFMLWLSGFDRPIIPPECGACGKTGASLGQVLTSSEEARLKKSTKCCQTPGEWSFQYEQWPGLERCAEPPALQLTHKIWELKSNNMLLSRRF